MTKYLWLTENISDILNRQVYEEDGEEVEEGVEEGAQRGGGVQ